MTAKHCTLCGGPGHSAPHCPLQGALKLAGGVSAGPLFAPVVVKRAAKRIGVNGSRRIHGMVRRASERRATPAWCDVSHVNDFYRLARIYTEATGIRHSAEHMVPLSHPLVCGLHVPANMEVSTLEENVRKGNRWWPDMPEVQVGLFS